MSTRDVSISISADGEQQFAQAMKNAQSAMKVFSSELKASEAAFQENGDAQAFLAKKAQILQAQLDQNEEIIQAYRRAVADMSQTFGEADARVDKYRIALNKAEEAGSKLSKALRETQQEAEDLGRDSTHTGRQLEDGIGDAADDVSDKLEKLDGRVAEINKSLGDIGKGIDVSAMIDVGRAAVDMVQGTSEAINQITEGTEDYRRQMSYLEQNAINSGFDFDYIKEQLFAISSLTGDIDGAFEGVSNLLASGFDGRELEEAIDLIGGAVIRFPETMKFENLAESLQESVSTKSATGAYAELLERLGVDLETVNNSLEKAKTAEEAQQIALAYLNENGLKETAENYKNMNADLISAEAAQMKYNDALGGLGEELSPLATSFTNFKTSVVGAFTDFLSGEEGTAITDKISGILVGATEYLESDAWKTDLQNIKADLDEAFGKIGEWLGIDGEAAGSEGMKGIIKGLDDDLDTALEGLKTIGTNITTSIGNGITEGTQSVIEKASSLWNSIKETLSRTITIPKPEFNAETYNGTGRTTASSYAAGGQNNTMTVITQVDGNTVGKATADSVSGVQGQQAQRASMYNR